LYKEKHSITVIENKWHEKTKAERKEIKIGVLLYIIVSIISIAGIATYSGSKNTRQIKSRPVSQLMITLGNDVQKR
jgi:hypothetical protein